MTTPSRFFRPQLLRSLARHTPRPLQQRRALHRTPAEHPHHDRFSTEGIDGLLTPEAYDMAWTRYQGLMVEKLNRLTAGEPIADLQPRELIVWAAREPSLAHYFNYASSAWNNDFFFKGISAHSDMPCPPSLTNDLLSTFHSFETLKTTLLTTADAMFGPGYVWLVYQRFGKASTTRGTWRILPTYLAGSPLADAHWRQQPTNMTLESPDSLDGITAPNNALRRPEQQSVQNAAGQFGPHSAAARKPRDRAPGGADVTPVLCVNTWEHVWLMDYGVEGKMEYLENWWRKIDWDRVAALSPSREGHMQQQY
ncbi:manganese and iron superoxide dismutase [Saccharata proteae CBS 121410]|uniref:Manganese and iron superoxide dismutase n=1 Tax=Saccharata proteae CBS 121410 TaxID=1314787 RepID=A0A9P4I276_9PEZI|nr:manganese and iron superoxide dismutase [Saccharata proteae CBS 121410]